MSTFKPYGKALAFALVAFFFLAWAPIVWAQYYPGAGVSVHSHHDSATGGILSDLTITSTMTAPAVVASSYIVGAQITYPDGTIQTSWKPDCSKSTTSTNGGTWKVPDGVSLVWLTGCGGGGGGNIGSMGSATGGGGAAGGGLIHYPVAVIPGEQISITIGAGGGQGGAGGATSFGSYISIPGGSAGCYGAGANCTIPSYTNSAYCQYFTTSTFYNSWSVNTFCGAPGGGNFAGYASFFYSGGGSTTAGGGGAGLFGPGAAGFLVQNGASAAANTCAGGGGSKFGLSAGSGGSGKLIVEYISN